MSDPEKISPSHDVSREPSEDGSEPGRQRIHVTGGDPWVRSASLHAKPPERKPRIPNWLGDDAEQVERRARLRKQSTVLGAMFAVIAMVVFLATRVMGPSLIVHLDGGAGYVYLDEERIGRTDEVLRVKFGQHTISVKPDDPLMVALPQVVVREFRFAWDPVAIKFNQAPLTSIMQLEAESGKQTEDEAP